MQNRLNQIKEIGKNLGIGHGSGMYRVLKKLYYLLNFPREIEGIFEKKLSTRGIILSDRIPIERITSFYAMFIPMNNGHELIRIGGKGDGGYLLPNDLGGIEACFSPGSGDSWKFEKELGENFGIMSHVIDGTVDKPKGFTSDQTFQKINLGAVTGEGEISLGDWIELHNSEAKSLLLQMDIEGSEYICINSLEEDILNRFRIIALEVHDLMICLASDAFMRQAEAMMEKLNKSHYLIHSHANNGGGTFSLYGRDFPKVIELTFHRKDRYIGSKEKFLPDRLDSRNIESRPEFPIQEMFDWIKSNQNEA